MANISKIKINGLNNNNAYDIVDSTAARAADLGGLSFSLNNTTNALQLTHNGNLITAATNTTLAEIATVIGELADAWEAAVGET